MSQTKKQIKPEIVERLKKLNHEKVGRMADALGVEPQTIRNVHFKNNSKTLRSLEYLEQIVIALELKDSSGLVEEVNIEE